MADNVKPGVIQNWKKDRFILWKKILANTTPWKRNEFSSRVQTNLSFTASTTKKTREINVFTII